MTTRRGSCANKLREIGNEMICVSPWKTSMATSSAKSLRGKDAVRRTLTLMSPEQSERCRLTNEAQIQSELRALNEKDDRSSGLQEYRFSSLR